MVLFRDQTALESAFAASPLSVKMPPPRASPIPSMSDIGQNEASHTEASNRPPPIERFTVEILQRTYNHELRIVDQLVAHMSPLYPVDQEGPPGVSINFDIKQDRAKAPQLSDYDMNLIRATAGAWKDWRSEIKKAGIPAWETIKAVVPEATPTSRADAPPAARPAPFMWGRQSEPQEVKKPVPSQPIPQKSSAISNPSPLPPDPTIQGLRWAKPRHVRVAVSSSDIAATQPPKPVSGSDEQQTPAPIISSELKTDDLQAPASGSGPASQVLDSASETQTSTVESSIPTAGALLQSIESEPKAILEATVEAIPKVTEPRLEASLASQEMQATTEPTRDTPAPPADSTPPADVEVDSINKHDGHVAAETTSNSIASEPADSLGQDQQITSSTEASPEPIPNTNDTLESTIEPSSRAVPGDLNAESQESAPSGGEKPEDSASMRVETNAEETSTLETDNKIASEASPAQETSETQAESRTAEAPPAEDDTKKPWWKLF
ncbi:hypothetical protein ABW21_db0205385 [Orbilia brochopaga]|nr:hypothetical protein ABW21_db0205385 [Drechslerella brochopaga]